MHTIYLSPHLHMIPLCGTTLKADSTYRSKWIAVAPIVKSSFAPDAEVCD